MRRGVTVFLAVASLAGCKRDVEIPPKPSVDALGVVPAFQSAAPRQSLQFAGAGGVAPYLFAFAQGGQLSGTDASLDPSGVYTAGSAGSAQDVLEVTDALGTKAIATVSVGQRIAITPAFTGVVPGGRISFQATGGSGNYVFAGGAAASGASVTPEGVYVAGSVGDVVDTVLVGDLYGAFAKAEVLVGARLQLYRSETRAVAPHETVAFIALGGQPPYTFSVAVKGSGPDARIDATGGVYVAGTRSADPDPDAVTTDVVRVTDSASGQPQSATLELPVGPRLRLRLASTQVFPGVVAQLAAGGGKPPYTFGFAPRVRAVAGDPATDPDRTRGGNGGNRSRGSVNAFSGEYVPGFSPGAIDFVQVTDATGAPAAILEGPPVGGVPFAIGNGVEGCVVADLNGDRSQDVVFAIGGDGSSKFTVGELLDTGTPVLQSYFTRRDPSATAIPSDFGGTGRDRIVMLGGDQRCSGGFCPALDVWSVTPNFAGQLSEEQVLGGEPEQWTTVLNDPAFQNGSGTAYHQLTRNYGIRNGTARYEAAAATWRFYAPGQISDTIQTASFSPGQSLCADSGPWDPTDAWLTRIDWAVGAARPAAPACLRVKSFCPACDGSNYQSAMGLAVGDFDGNGKTDLAWILQTDDRNRLASGAAGAKLHVAFGTAASDPTGLTTLYPASGQKSGWPGVGYSFELDSTSSDTRLAVVRPPPGSPPGTADALLVRLREDSTGRGRLFLVRDPAQPWVGPLPGAGASDVDGVRGYAPAPGAPTSWVSWNGNDGVLSGFGVALAPALAFGPVSTTAVFPFAVNTVCLPDVNADGAPDLVAASDNGATAQLVIGDGTLGAATTGTFGAQTHQRGGVFPLAVGDLDGDGFGDAVVANQGTGMSVLWGGGGMLAWGEQLSPAPVGALTLADYYGEGRPSVLYQEKSGRFGKLRSRGDGTFDPAEALTGYSGTGGAAGSHFFIWPAALGTSEAGPDAFAITKNGGFAALLVQNGQVVEVTPKPVPALDPNHTNTRDCWPVALGGDSGAVALGCSYENRLLNGVSDWVAVFGAVISNPDGEPGTGGGAPAFGDWVLLTSTVVSPGNPFTSSPPAGANAHVAMAGTQDVPGWGPGTAVFVMGTDKLYAIEVRKTAGPPAEWTEALGGVRAIAVTPDTVGQPFLGTAGIIDTTSAFGIAVAGDSGTFVIRRTDTGYELVQQLSSRAFPLGIAPLSMIAPGLRSPGDVVTFLGDFGNTGLTPEIVPRLNDGTGKLK